MTTKTFTTTLTKSNSRVVIALPFDPNAAWGEKARHHVRGTIGGRAIRGSLVAENGVYSLPLGAAWRRDNGLEAGAEVEVALSPEGPQHETLAPDIARALNAEAQAKEFFVALPTFYRKNYIRWIESAKRPETRAARIEEMVALLKAGQKQK